MSADHNPEAAEERRKLAMDARAIMLRWQNEAQEHPENSPYRRLCNKIAQAYHELAIEYAHADAIQKIRRVEGRRS